jgi:hypothetical protein
MSAGFSLDAGEQITRRINRHWIDIASITFTAGLMWFIALVASYGFGRYREQFPVFITNTMMSLLIVIFLGLGTLIMVIGLWVYRRNYVLITNIHIIQVEQRGLFTSQVDQVSLGRIQDVSGERHGIVATMLNFGTVTVQSAGESRQFIMPHVPDPQPLADYILELHEQFLQKNPNMSGE